MIRVESSNCRPLPSLQSAEKKYRDPARRITSIRDLKPPLIFRHQSVQQNFIHIAGARLQNNFRVNTPALAD
ncbi:hypothetical protein chiPu_0008087 [Chiloscyllium punctatum]|uniref:Uncharacterized protein n=1 Tax=Chiloscyllium punctatum TaxID=137246 RepID=A0A401SGZ0_CHIPU|nr:hypothetical protein [Chiloscyllium punctatum]